MSVHDFHLPIIVVGCVAAYTVIGSFVGTAAYCCDKEYPHQKTDPYVLVGAFWPITLMVIALFYLGYLPHLAAKAMFSPKPPRDIPTAKELEGMREPPL